MKKFLIHDVQNYIEENCQYCKLLKERFINEEKYANNLLAIKQGLAFLDISDEPIKIFENRVNFVIWLGHRLTNYKGYELALYIGHKKMGLPIPDTLIEKCADEIVQLIENAGQINYIQGFNKELKKVSFSPEIFLSVHRSIMIARAENLLDDLLFDIAGFGATSIKDAIRKIPQVYLNYLSQASLMKLIRKVSLILREITGKMEQELKNIDLYALRLKEQLHDLYLEVEKGLKDIIEHEVEKGVDINVITQKTSNLFSRFDRLFLGNVYHLKDYEKRRDEIDKFLQQEEDFRCSIEKRTSDRRIKIDEIFDDFMFYNKFGSLTKEENKIFAKILTQEFEQLHRQKSRSLSLLNVFEKRGLLSVEIKFDKIKEAYNSFMKQVIIPQYIGQCFLDIVNCLPPPNDQPQRLVNDLANMKILSLEGKYILTLPKKGRDYPEDIKNYIEPFRKCITILVYDIRGSSYMGTKLHDAVREQKIKYKFAKEMADIVKKYGGFLLKDTGDGGLVWFAENSMSLYNRLYTESVTGRGIKLRSSIFTGADFDLIPACDAAKRAVLCARDMVQRAEEFIRANYMHYREWFAKVAKRTLELDGITYALLPPEFKSLFRIGVGIASGMPNKDVVFCANSHGDPDLVGPIIADAFLYSMERQPGRSVVICDLPSLTNMLLNIENFEYLTEKKNFEQYIKSVDDLRENNHGYKFTDHKISIVPKGIQYLEELKKDKAVTDAELSDIQIDGDFLYNNQRKNIKLVYEIKNI